MHMYTMLYCCLCYPPDVVDRSIHRSIDRSIDMRQHDWLHSVGSRHSCTCIYISFVFSTYMHVGISACRPACLLACMFGSWQHRFVWYSFILVHTLSPDCCSVTVTPQLICSFTAYILHFPGILLITVGDINVIHF